MAERLRRLAVVGLIPSMIDIGLLVVLRQRLGWALVAADLLAITVASAVSYVLHRVVTFRSDPYVRWVHVPVAFVGVAAVAALVDVAVLRTAFAITGFESTGGLVVTKLVALACAAAIRLGGYRGVLLASMNRSRRQRSARPQPPGAFRLSVVVPAHNEVDRIVGTVATLRRGLVHIADTGGLEIVVVDDGSSDGTGDAALETDADQVVLQPYNRGKGAAVRSGALAARGRAVVFTDADLAYSPEQVLRILHAVEDGWDAAIGDRRHPQTRTLESPGRVRAVGSRVINLLSHAVLLGGFHDTQSGLKGFRSDVGRALFSMARIDGFAFDIELLHLVERREFSLTEIAVEVSHSSRSTVGFGDAVALVWDLFRIRHWSAIGLYEGGGDPVLAADDGSRSRQLLHPEPG